MNKLTKVGTVAALVAMVGLGATACDDDHHHHDTKKVKSTKTVKPTTKGKK